MAMYGLKHWNKRTRNLNSAGFCRISSELRMPREKGSHIFEMNSVFYNFRAETFDLKACLNLLQRSSCAAFVLNYVCSGISISIV